MGIYPNGQPGRRCPGAVGGKHETAMSPACSLVQPVLLGVAAHCRGLSCGASSGCHTRYGRGFMRYAVLEQQGWCCANLP